MRRILALLALTALLPLSSACSDKQDAPTPTGDSKSVQPWRATGVGGSGTFVQTFDEVAWRSRSLSDVTLFGIVCVGQLNGWAVGARGSIAHTTDSGDNWIWQTSGITADLHAVRFADENHGFAVGDGGAMVVTSDGGAHWSSIPTTATTPTTSVDLRGAAIGGDVWIAVGANGTVVRSVNAGASWTTYAIEGATNLRGVAMDAGAHLTLAVDDAGAIWSSESSVDVDGRMSLQPTFAREFVAASPLASIAIDDGGGVALAAGAQGTILVRDPLSRVWSVEPSPTAVDLHAALVLSNGTRFVVAGVGGTMLTRMTDASRWTTIPISTTSTIEGLEDL